MSGMLGAPSSEPVSSCKGDIAREWLPDVRSSSMVSYLKLLRAFLRLRRRFVSATLRSRREHQTAVEGTIFSGWWLQSVM